MKKRLKSKITVVVRPQTSEEDRQFRAALSLFLVEMVRQGLSIPRRNHEQQRIIRKTVCQSGPMQYGPTERNIDSRSIGASELIRQGASDGLGRQ